jgi:hypothetical protein
LLLDEGQLRAKEGLKRINITISMPWGREDGSIAVALVIACQSQAYTIASCSRIF